MKRFLLLTMIAVLAISCCYTVFAESNVYDLYDKSSPVVNQFENTDSFIHTDTDSGVTFTVPANWRQKEFSKDREFIDVKFVSTTDDGCSMIYGSTDIWSQMSASERYGYTRSDFNNSAFTKSDIAAMANITASKVVTVTYNGIEYFKCEINYTSNTYGITANMTQLYYFDNGWMYMFQFGGTSTHKLYSDFENLVKSVKYPDFSTNVNKNDLTDTTTPQKLNSNSGNNSGEIFIVTSLAFGAVIVVVSIISHKINKTDTANETNLHNNASSSQLDWLKDKDKKTKIEKINLFIGWIVLIALFLVYIFFVVLQCISANNI